MDTAVPSAAWVMATATCDRLEHGDLAADSMRSPSSGSRAGHTGARAGRRRVHVILGTAATTLVHQVQPIAFVPEARVQGCRSSPRCLSPTGRCDHADRHWPTDLRLRGSRLGRRERLRRIARGPAGFGIVESLVATAAIVAVLSKPRSAPGPSEELLQRERRARKAVLVAREAVQKGAKRGEADQKSKQQLAEAKRELFDVERELEEAGADLRAFPLPEYLQASECPGQIRIAVTGASGVGKSSWINALRRLLPNDKDAAETGVTETTMKPTMYRFRGRSTGPLRRALDRVFEGGKRLVNAVIPFKKEQGMENFISLGDRVLVSGLGRKNIKDGSLAEVVGVYPDGDIEVQLVEGGRFARCRRNQVAGILPECVLFDLPGVGTPSYPQATYLKDMGLRHYDFVVLLTSTRFTEAELLLMEGLQYWGVPFFLVRNKVDVDVQNEIDKAEDTQGKQVDAKRKKEIEQETMQRIRDFFKEEFKITDLYLVSSKRKLIDQFDFRKLEADMEVALKKQRLVEAQDIEAPVEPDVGDEVQDDAQEEPKAAGVKQRIDGLLEENGVVVFSKTWCPYCTKAKALLQAEGVRFASVELDLMPQDEADEMQTTLGQMTGARTVPRIFSRGECLGGCDDIVALQRSGRLAGKLPAGTTAAQPPHAEAESGEEEAQATARRRFQEELAAASKE